MHVIYISWSSVGFYSLLSTFVYYQQLHTKNFRGGSQAVVAALNLSALIGMLTGISYLVYYGWMIKWWVPIVAVGAGLIATFPAAMVEKYIGTTTISFVGFIGWPLSAYYAFYYIPK